MEEVSLHKLGSLSLQSSLYGHTQVGLDIKYYALGAPVSAHSKELFRPGHSANSTTVHMSTVSD